MPRRPRPASRRAPPTAPVSATPSKDQGKTLSSSHKPRIVEDVSEPESEHESEHEEYSGAGDGSEDDSGASAVDDDEAEEAGDVFDDVDVDAPRVAQYMDEEDLDELDEDESDTGSSSDEEEPSRLTTSQQNDLASLPFGALRKAQVALTRASALSDSEEEEGSDEDNSEPEQSTTRLDVKGKGRETGEIPKPKKDIPKRSSKHAPTEVTSKRPVPRKKLEAEGEKIVPRDPRFLPLAGEFSSKKFQSQYSFLSEMHAQEVKTLRENLKRARKLLINSPRDLREEREQEVQRLERAFKRAESMVSKDRREKVEQEALERVAKEEKEKRKSGKGAWYMKDSDKKDLLLRAKYDALAASGGRGAVRKAIEKKQKKVNQKEKKRRPFALGQPGAGGGGSGRMPKRLSGGAGDDGQRSGKRRRIAP